MDTPPAPFEFPRYYSFPPMFTLQPNQATRAAQMDKWSALIQAYCAHHGIFRLALSPTSSATAASAAASTATTTTTASAAAAAASASPGGGSGGSSVATGAAAAAATPATATHYPDELFHNRRIGRALPAEALRDL